MDGEPIPEEEVVRLTRLIKARIDGEDKNRSFTFFDFTTALAFEYFKDQGVDVAVVEVGLGGRLDSTNVVQPLVSVITNVEFDHQDYLGNYDRRDSARKGRSDQGERSLWSPAQREQPSRSYGMRPHRGPISMCWARPSRSQVRASNPCRTGGSTHPSTGSRSASGETISSSTRLSPCAPFELWLRAVLLSTRKPSGRASRRRSGPEGSNWSPNLPGNRQCCSTAHITRTERGRSQRSCAPISQDRKKILLFGVMKDKDFRGMLSELLPVVQRVILTKPEIARAALPADIVACAPGARVTDSVRDGIAEAFKTAGEKDLVVIAGSFYTVGEAKRLLDEPA